MPDPTNGAPTQHIHTYIHMYVRVSSMLHVWQYMFGRHQAEAMLMQCSAGIPVMPTIHSSSNSFRNAFFFFIFVFDTFGAKTIVRNIMNNLKRWCKLLTNLAMRWRGRLFGQKAKVHKFYSLLSLLACAYLLDHPFLLMTNHFPLRGRSVVFRVSWWFGRRENQPEYVRTRVRTVTTTT